MDEVKFKDGRVADFSYGEDLVELFLETVPDRAVRSMLFDFYLESDPNPDETSFSGYTVIHTMRRIICAAFVIALCRWKQSMDNLDDWADEDDERFFENSRFTKLFQSALSNEDITLDLQIFALMELWVNLKDAPEHVRTQFDVIYDRTNKYGDEIGLTLQKVRDASKNATFKGAGNAGKYTAEYINELCYRLLRSFTVFQGLTVIYPAENKPDDKRDFRFTYRTYNGTVDLYPNETYSHGKLIVTEMQLRAMCGKELDSQDTLSLYLLSETTAFDGKPQNTYRSFDGERDVRVAAKADKSLFERGDNYDDLKEVRRFLSFNYKNIREFAVIITDAVTDSHDMMTKLSEICQSNPNLRSCCSVDANSPNLYWDNIITLMLVEIGISDFLEIILKDDKIFKQVMKNAGRRCIEKNRASALLKKCQANTEKARAQKHVSAAEIENQVLDLRVQTVLDAMNPAEKSGEVTNPFEESLSYKYNNICVCTDILSKKALDKNELGECIKTLSDLFKNIFDFLEIFYAGLNKYSECDQNYDEKSEQFDEEHDTPRDKFMRRHTTCIKAFKSAASDKYGEIKDRSLTQAFDGFCEMCARYNKFSDGSSLNSSEEAKNLKYLITRNYVCDVEKLRRFATITFADGETSTIFDMLENFSIKYYNDPSYQEWLTYFKDLFLFLIYNDDYNERGLYKSDNELEDKDCDPIYPYIVTYYKENVDRDNLKKCAYRVPIPTAKKGDDSNGQGFVVTLLTENDYPANTYFCIPLRYGSSKSWWINPFLIPKSIVQDIFKAEASQKQQ